MARTAPARAHLNLTSLAIRERLLPGEQWWADIGHRHDPDWQGNQYMRLFAEEKTGYAVPLFSVDKSTASLLVQLVAMETWVRLNVPHGHFRLLRTDFGSEYATQGHGDNYLVAALQAFIAERLSGRAMPASRARFQQGREHHTPSHRPRVCQRMSGTPRSCGMEPARPGYLLPAQLPATLATSWWGPRRCQGAPPVAHGGEKFLARCS